MSTTHEDITRWFTTGIERGARYMLVIVDTWDKLSHQYRKRFFFVKAGRELLTISMMQGEFAAMAPVLDALVGSFALVDTLEQTGPGDRESQPE